MEKNILYGRRLLTRELKEIPNEIIEHNKYQIKTSILLQGSWLNCQRCHTRTKISKVKGTESFYYCPHCIFLGRCDNNQQLYLFEQPDIPSREIVFAWKGQLTSLQKEIASKLVSDVPKKHHLIWAVTGAGKTEMLYEIIRKTLKNGGRVAVVSPRVDVCDELYLRFSAVFPKEEIVRLHGKSKEVYHFSLFVIATTHQLYRFYQAFDLLVVDEVDAFPYAQDQGLAYAVETALKLTGKFVYLSATPDEKLLKKISSSFEVHRLPLRFHQRLLPEPILIFWNHWAQNCLKEKKISPLLKILTKLLKENNVLLFCPNIARMNQLKMVLRMCLPKEKITDASAKDLNRTVKVQKMREHHYDVLLTTMILERGVTFENISVIVLGADHRVFTKSSLVQIAGRADRKGEYTNSQVYFFYEEKTKAIKQACREIKEMNRQAKQYLCQ